MSTSRTKDKKTGMVYRADTFDLGIIRERKTYEPLGIKSGDRVLDVGANIGAFSHLALSAGVAMVHAYEPDPENFSLLLANTEEWRQIVKIKHFQKAVVPQSVAELFTHVPFYINKEGTNKALHSTVEHRGRPSFDVQAISWEDVLSQIGWVDIVKIDIEGAEYGLPVWEIPYSVRALAIELHLSKRGFKEQAVEYDRKIQEAKFEPMRPLEYTEKTRAKLMIYQR